MGADNMLPAASSSEPDQTDGLANSLDNLTLAEKVAQHPTAHPDVQVVLRLSLLTLREHLLV